MFRPNTRTRANHLFKMARIKRELGHCSVARTDSMFLEEWLASFCKTADQFNKWRYSLVMLWKLAVAKHLAAANEPEKIEQRSTSKKLAMNQKVRHQLNLDGYKAIHKNGRAAAAHRHETVSCHSSCAAGNLQHGP